MRGSFFDRERTVVTALFHIDGDMEKDLALIRLSAANGAQGIALQLEDVPPEMRTADNYRKLMAAAPELPFMFISYRKDKWFGDDDDARQACLLLAAEMGAEVIDVMGDLYAPAPFELTFDPAAVEKQYGKGKVIYFASQPFGNSSLALKPGAWLDFFAAQAKEADEETGLAIWDFTIPEERLHRPALKQFGK